MSARTSRTSSSPVWASGIMSWSWVRSSLPCCSADGDRQSKAPRSRSPGEAPGDAATHGHGVVARSSAIPGAGLGLFADGRSYETGEIVTEYVGAHSPDVLSKKQAMKCNPQTHLKSVTTGHAYIDGLKVPEDGKGAASFANDCYSIKGQTLKNPVEGGATTYEYNCVFRVSKKDPNRVFLKATHEVLDGEEFYVSYGSDREVAVGRSRLKLKTLPSGEQITEREPIRMMTRGS